MLACTGQSSNGDADVALGTMTAGHGDSYRGGMSHDVAQSDTQLPRPRSFGLPFLALIGLAALRVPASILEDLRAVEAGHWVGGLLPWVAVAVWVVVAVVWRVPHPFSTVLMIGAISGVLLVITYQVLWDVLFGAYPSEIGGSGVAIRLIAIPGGFVAGVVSGAVGGLVAWAISAATRRRRTGTE